MLGVASCPACPDVPPAAPVVPLMAQATPPTLQDPYSAAGLRTPRLMPKQVTSCLVLSSCSGLFCHLSDSQVSKSTKMAYTSLGMAGEWLNTHCHHFVSIGNTSGRLARAVAGGQGQEGVCPSTQCSFMFCHIIVALHLEV